jgi:hypothetical protein
MKEIVALEKERQVGRPINRVRRLRPYRIAGTAD